MHRRGRKAGRAFASIEFGLGFQWPCMIRTEGLGLSSAVGTEILYGAGIYKGLQESRKEMAHVLAQVNQ